MQKGKTLEQVEAGLWKQLDDLKQNPPSAAEIERVRAQMIAGMVYEKDSIAAQASSIGQLESVGLSWKLIDQDLEALKAVTPDDIQKAARTYFTPSRLTLAQVLPVKAEGRPVMSERTGLRYGLLGLIVIALLAALAYFVARPTQTPAAAHAAAVEENQLQSLKDVAKQAPVHRKLDIQEWKTAEGAKVLFVEAHELPMFDLRLTFAAGAARTPAPPACRC